MATALDARYRPADRRLTYASAGHPTPLIVRRDDAFFAPVQPGAPLGFATIAPPTQSLVLDPTDTVLFCPDGLYEQRRSTLDESLERLRLYAVAAARTVDTLDGFVDQLLHIPLSDTSDDACLLVLRA